MKNFELGLSAKTLMLSLLAMGALGISGTVAAQNVNSEDTKSWTGAICDPSGGSSYNALSTTASGIKNTSSNPRYVSCSPTTDSQMQWTYGDYVGGTDNGYAELSLNFDFSTAAEADVSCTVQVLGLGNDINETVSKTIRVGAGASSANMSMPKIYLGSSLGRPFGVSCLLPPQAKLARIGLTEAAKTGQ